MANLNDFPINARIRHGVYGLGTISAINPLHTTIEFDENGIRKFMTTMVQLEHTEEAPPPPPKRSRKKAVAKK